MTNREWGQIRNGYLKSLFAIGFQGFLTMICVGIHAVLANNMIIADNLYSAIFLLAAYTVILCFPLFKSGVSVKSIFLAHQRRVKGRVEIFRAKRRKYDPTLVRITPI